MSSELLRSEVHQLLSRAVAVFTPWLTDGDVPMGLSKGATFRDATGREVFHPDAAASCDLRGAVILAEHRWRTEDPEGSWFLRIEPWCGYRDRVRRTALSAVEEAAAERGAESAVAYNDAKVSRPEHAREFLLDTARRFGV